MTTIFAMGILLFLAAGHAYVNSVFLSQKINSDTFPFLKIEPGI